MRISRSLFIPIVILICTSSLLRAQERRLESIHGTMIMMISEKQGIPSEFWAKGDYLRSELSIEGEKLISLQRDGVVYVYPSKGNTGVKNMVGRGLGSLGLVQQINEIKSRGEIKGSEKIDGVLCDLYAYDVNLPEESALVMLSRESGLPMIWVSILRSDGQEPQVLRMMFRNLEANVKIPDSLFEIPKSVRFSEEADTTFPPFSKASKPVERNMPPLKKSQRESPSNLYVVGVSKAKVMTNEGVAITTVPLGTILGTNQSKGKQRWIEKGAKNGWVDDRDLIPFEKAAEYFSNALRDSPQDPDLLLGRARYSYSLAQVMRKIPGFDQQEYQLILDSALADFKQSALLRPSVDAFAGSGWIYALREKYQESIAEIDQGLKIDPNATELLQKRAWSWLSSGNLDSALADCDRILAVDSMNADAHGLKCYVLGRKGEWDDAMNECDTALQVDPMLASAYFFRGTIWEGKKDDSHAKIDFDSAISFGEDAARSHRARILYQSGNLRKAVEDLNVSIDLQPNNSDLWLQRGTAYVQLDDLENGLDDLSKSIELKETADALTNRAIAWIKKEEFDKAIQDFKRSATLNPDLPLTYYNLARLHYDLGQYKESVVALTEYVRLMPEDPDGYAQRGLARYLSGDSENAIADLDFAIERMPKNAMLYIYRGSAFNSTKEFDRAIDDFTHAIGLDPKSAMAHTFRGVAWKQKGDLRQASFDFNKAVELDPKSNVVYINRGSYYYSLGNYEKAKLDYETALRIIPGQAPVLNELAEILSTAPVDSVRNGLDAVKLARSACELTEWKNAEYQGTLASAYAEIGDFQNAVLWQNRCIEMGSVAAEKDAREKLLLFRGNKPFRTEKRLEGAAK